MPPALGVYISVPFCRAKCTYCNFASDVFAPERMDAYVDRVCGEIASARTHATQLSADLPDGVDTVYFGGGTPSLLGASQLRRIFESLGSEFLIDPDAEITLECAPGQLAPETLEELQRHRLNRISFGIQSFNDAESKAVGRTHTRDLCLAEIDRMCAAGIPNISLDLIVGLPHQTHASWRNSVRTAIASGVPHVSIYMLEVDEDSRLGREVLAAGGRYGASTIPSEDHTAEWYSQASEILDHAGIAQYEISNFARPGFASRHNLKYWLRDPYLGFGLDAHSMLYTSGLGPETAVRFANTDDLDSYLGATGLGSLTTFPVLPSVTSAPKADRITAREAFEEALFLGLRLNDGIDLGELSRTFGSGSVDTLLVQLADTEQAGLVERRIDRLRLTPQGRIVSNEVFGRVLIPAEPTTL